MLLFEGNRVMLFRTALALMEFYGNWYGTTLLKKPKCCVHMIIYSH